MRVIVDTVVWSRALRRTDPDEDVAHELTGLIQDQRAILLGPIRQEVLSGYSDRRRFEQLRDRLRCFPNEPIEDSDYIQAAEFHNLCRTAGIQGSHTDFLICACAFRLNALIFTSDADFRLYSGTLPVSLYKQSDG